MHTEDLKPYLGLSPSDPQASEIASHLADCPQDRHKLGDPQLFLDQLAELSRSQSAHPSPAERRKSQRVPTKSPARIKVLYPNVSELLTVRVLDVSGAGLKIEVSHLLEAGATVEMIMERIIAIGEVRYCIPSGKKYYAGVAIQNAFARSGPAQ